MNDVPIGLLFFSLATLILMSAFFSSSETGMMSLNRYRLRHKARDGDKSANRTEQLLKRPDQLIGVILIGNNLVNIAAASLATVIAMRMFPDNTDLAISVATLLLTIVVLVFAEVTPKTYAQQNPERIAYPASHILKPLKSLLAPAVWAITKIAAGLMWLLGIRHSVEASDALSKEELRSIVSESGEHLQAKRQNMLLGVLELDDVTVEDIMVPKHEVRGIDLDWDIEKIRLAIATTDHTRMPVFKGDLDKVVGMLHVRDTAEFMLADEPEKVMLTRKASDPLFVPESMPLQTQLLNFQRDKKRIGLVVDEYGDIQGLVTLEDILEEIVGEFTTDQLGDSKVIHPQRDGSYVIDGSASVREVNRSLKWELPTEEARTLSGLIIEHLEDIPDANMSLKIAHYAIEILQVKDNTITAARISLIED
ncbi:HlyC/CorC family transporter [Salinibius halmophilus]|uniref:HlyC/CorC family transporter n=1 Tax=Salinibius halmophilus TaxID=1853216 RepID=UPI00131498E6|nr:HlyC/CorC family transporter [Salinibius halmophilus]